MVNIYYRIIHIFKSYQYLSELEKSICTYLGLVGSSDQSFTREGDFYWKKREPLQNKTKYVYMDFIIFDYLG